MCCRSTSSDHIEGWGRSLLHGNQLNTWSRATVVFLNLCEELGALFNHVVHCAAIPTGRSGVSTVASQVTNLVTIVTHNLASTSAGHPTTATTAKSTSAGGTAVVTIAIIIGGFIVDSVGIRGAISHKVIATTFFFIMPDGLTKLAVGVFGNLNISLKKMAVLRVMLTRGVKNLTIYNTGIELGGRPVFR